MGQFLVVVTPVKVQEIGLPCRVVGTVLPFRISTIGSPLDGHVLTFDMNSGDSVKSGQRLAQLRPDTFNLPLAAAKAQLELNRQQYAELANGPRYCLPDQLRSWSFDAYLAYDDSDRGSAFVCSFYRAS